MLSKIENQSWRSYQLTLKRTVLAKKRARLVAQYSPLFPWSLSILFALFFSFGGSACQTGSPTKKTTASSIPVTDATAQQEIGAKEKVSPSYQVPETPEQQPPLYSKNDIKKLIDQDNFLNLQDKCFTVAMPDKTLTVETSLDIPLQRFLLDRLEEVKQMKNGQPRHIGIVAINPEDGSVIAMASFDKDGQMSNHCLMSDSPAASIFKIVTASAAIEKGWLNPMSSLEYTGNKYTLYQSQLKENNNKYANRVTLKQSFAESINPIFGKIGVHMLKKDLLTEFADAFCFNHNINFELPVSISPFEPSDNPYELAELACGFNRKTYLSPLHGALLTSVFLNQGRLIEPTIIEKITDENGTLLYKSNVKLINNPLSKETSEAVKNMMAATVQSGTARKAFRGFQRDPILSKLFIGGKTGSICNKTKELRYDWFSGFAEEKNGSKKIAVSVVVAHEKLLGPRAGNYAKLTMKTFFNNESNSGQALSRKEPPKTPHSVL